MQTEQEALVVLQNTWPYITKECGAVLGSELHYQAMIYYCLRHYGRVPKTQIGMNVKMWIDHPVSDEFKALDRRKHQDFQGGFEPIPDIVLFSPQIRGDWRRRNNHATLLNMLVAIEVKASERAKGRLTGGEITKDIRKLRSQRGS